VGSLAVVELFFPSLDPLAMNPYFITIKLGFRRHISRLHTQTPMFGNNRTTKLALVGAAAIVFGLGMISPALACTEQSLTTTVLCSSSQSGPFAACPYNSETGTSTIPAGDWVQDSATVGVSGILPDTNPTVSFYLVQGSIPSTGCPSSIPTNTPEGTGVTVTWSGSSGTAKSDVVATDSLTTGTYYFYVVYDHGSSGYTWGWTWGGSQYGGPSNGYSFDGITWWYAGSDGHSAYTCEQFTGTTGGSFPPPPSGVPQFPLGMAALMALAIPALLLLRRKQVPSVTG